MLLSCTCAPAPDRRAVRRTIARMTRVDAPPHRATVSSPLEGVGDGAAFEFALEAAGIGVFAFDVATGEQRFSACCRALWGMAAHEEPTPALLVRRMHPDDRHLEDLVRASLDPHGPGTFDVQHRIVLPDGRIRWIHSRGRTLFEDAGPQRRAVRSLGTMVDVTRARVEEELIEAIRRLDSPQAVVDRALSVLRRTLVVDRCAWSEFEEDGEHSVILGDDAEPDMPPLQGRFATRDFGPTFRDAMLGGYACVIHDAQEQIGDPAERANYAAIGIAAAVAWPVQAGGRIVAGVALHQRRPRRWQPDEIDLVRVVAQRCQEAIHRVRAERRRAETEAALREADRRKDQFLATLSHELRNPLAPIRNASHILGMPGLRDEQLRNARDVIQRQVGHMALLLDDLLDVSRITRGKLELKKARVELAPLVDAAVETVRPLLERKRHAFEATLPPQPLALQADPLRVSQILSNLLNNAAKYTDAGGHIRLSAWSQDGAVVLEVADDGIGIAPEALPHLFQMFSQVQGTSGRSEGGLGIGLALVRGLAELHGGQVEAHSEGPGRGSRFRVQLPLGEQAPAGVAQPASGGSGGGARILVVDDNGDAADTLALLLEASGHEVRVAYDGRGGLAAAREFRPDVALLDIGLPDVSGHELARSIRREPWGAKVRLVALTGWGQDEDRRRTSDAGFDEHLTKPVDPAVLARVLRPRAAGA
jgi:signal transduction histidine kinase